LKTIIVGHGPSLEGQGLGEWIDSFDNVVRLKRAEYLIRTNPKDYGVKTDYLCASTEVLGCFKTIKVHEFWGYPKRGWYDENAVEAAKKELNAYLWIPLNLCNTWNAKFRNLGAKHPNVSTGMASIVMALERFRPETLQIAGFDTLFNPELPFTRAELPRTGTGAINHDWIKENQLLTMLRDFYKVSFETNINRTNEGNLKYG